MCCEYIGNIFFNDFVPCLCRHVVEFFLPGRWYAGIPSLLRRWSVGIVVKKITSTSSSNFLILLAIDSSLVKCPKPTPLVGNITTDLRFSVASKFGCSNSGMAFFPNRSNPREKISHGKEIGRKIRRHGFSTAVIR